MSEQYYKHHVFFCLNQRDDGRESCGPRGAEQAQKHAKKRCKELSKPDKPRGVGLAVGVYGCGLDGPDGSEAAIELTPDGVVLLNSWQDHGQGADLARADREPP